jgi:hypothetical protein
MSLKNSNDAIGNRTRDLPVCSVVHVDPYMAELDNWLDVISTTLGSHIAVH